LQIDSKLLDGLEALQSLAGAPVIVHAGYRCPRHNQQVGGVPGSEHLAGLAADVSVPGLSMQRMYELALEVPQFAAGGIGVYDGNFLHVDVRQCKVGAGQWAIRGSFRTGAGTGTACRNSERGACGVTLTTMIPAAITLNSKTANNGCSGWRRRLHALANFTVLAAEEEQRLSVANDDFLDLGDEDGVITGVLRRVQAAFQICQRALQNGRAVLGTLKASASFLGGTIVGSCRARIILRNSPLILAKYVHSEALLRVQMCVGAGALVDAH